MSDPNNHWGLRTKIAGWFVRSAVTKSLPDPDDTMNEVWPRV
jgi:hypothetical protein